MSTANKGHIMLICRKLILIGSFTMHATFPIHFTEDGHFGELTTLLLDSTMSPLVLRTTNLKSFRTAQFASQGIFTTKRYLNEQKSKSCLLFRGFIHLFNSMLLRSLNLKSIRISQIAPQATLIVM